METSTSRIMKRVCIPAVFVLIACVIAAVLVLSGYTTAYAVSVDGEQWGYVEDSEAVDETIQTVEDKVGKVLGHDYKLNMDIECEQVFVQKSQVCDDMQDLEVDLYCSVPEITDAYVLRIDGEAIGLGEKNELEQIVDDVSLQYETENTVDIEIISTVDIEYETIASDTESDEGTISDSLTSVVDDEIVYEVNEKETIEDVADNADVSVEQVITLNPELTDKIYNYAEENDLDNIEITADDEDTEDAGIPDEEDPGTNAESEEMNEEDSESVSITENPAEIASEVSLDEGTILTVEPETALLEVQSIDLESREEKVPYETKETEDDTMYAGETKVIQEGSDGTAYVWEYVTKTNGIETERVYDHTVVAVKPTAEIIAVGTKEEEIANTAENTADQTTVSDTNENTDSGTVSASDTSTGSNSVSTGMGAGTAQTNNDTGSNTAVSNSITTANNTANNSAANNGGTANNTNTGNTASTSDDSTPTQAATSDTTTMTEQNNTAVTTTTSSSADELRAQVVAYAKQFLGCAYAYGGHGPYTFDCSGLTGYVYAHFGYSLPWTVTGQYACGTYVPLDVNQMLPGDLIFWSYGGSTPTHVGMYIGNGQYIQATKPGDVVRINTVSSYAGQPLVGCRRIIN